MSSNVINQVSYLITTRSFPRDVENLVIELSRTYIDIASAVNVRTIGLFATKPSITGESWYLTKNQKQQGLRQAYSFTTTNPLPHEIDLANISRITRCYGEYTDGTNWYGLINGTNIAIAGQISFYLDPTNINFLIGASAPALKSGTIVIEWISKV